MEPQPDSASHWDDAYALGDDTRSWFQQQPKLSLQMLDSAGVSPADSLIDVGGGSSPLADALLSRGFKDITVLDISVTGMQHARQRLGARASQVQWLVADVLTWPPDRRYQVWHDRAVFHFLTSDQARKQYMHTLHAATSAAAVAVFGCFALDGPQYCSGLPVLRYSPDDLGAELGSQWALTAHAREEHTTPGGILHPFSWAAFSREP
jgi:trans-aconitate methyltransferase